MFPCPESLIANARELVPETIGYYWHIPNVRKTGQFPHVLVNYWKRFTVAAAGLQETNHS